MNNTETKKETAIDAFIEKNQNALEKLEIIKTALNNHMGTNPDDINWANVGDLGYINEQLDNILGFIGPVAE